MALQTLAPISSDHGFETEIPNEIVTKNLFVVVAVHAPVSEVSHLNDFTVDILSANHDLVSGQPSNTIDAQVNAVGATHELKTFMPVLTTGGGIHDYTEWVSYSGQDYLKCRHIWGTLTGTYTSPVFDIGGAEAANRHLIYGIGEDPGEIDIAIIGTGTTWADKIPDPATWASVNAASQSWSEIFNLPGAPSVSMRLYYGAADPPTSYIDYMEILSAIIPAGNQYFQLRITITDPSEQVYAYVEAYTIKFCTY